MRLFSDLTVPLANRVVLEVLAGWRGRWDRETSPLPGDRSGNRGLRGRASSW
jgi:hypothetical protein